MVFIATCKRNAGCRLSIVERTPFSRENCVMLVTNIVTPSKAAHFNLTQSHLHGCRGKEKENWQKMGKMVENRRETKNKLKI